MTESKEEPKPDVGEHDEGDQRGGGGEGGLSGAVPGASEEATPEGETSVNEPDEGQPAKED
jgi:hypothetical protein